MTLANSMILVDQTAVPLAVPELIRDLGGDLDEGPWILTANILPLAAFMVLGGRLGDLLGLRRVFLAGASIFVVSSMLVGFSQDTMMAIAARGAAGDRRGADDADGARDRELGLPEGRARPGARHPRRPLGLLRRVRPGPRRGAERDRLAPGLPDQRAARDRDDRADAALGAASWRPSPAPSATSTTRASSPSGSRMAGIVFGLTQASGESDWTQPAVVISLAGSVVALRSSSSLIEHRVANPLIEFRLFRHLNFLAANISQVLAGMVELGMGFLLPAYLLLVIGVSPAVAGLALIPATVPIILAGPARRAAPSTRSAAVRRS